MSRCCPNPKKNRRKGKESQIKKQIYWQLKDLNPKPPQTIQMLRAVHEPSRLGKPLSSARSKSDLSSVRPKLGSHA